MIQKIKNKLNLLDEHSLEVAKKSGSSLIAKVIGMFASFLVSIFIGRTLGAEGLGVINLANQIINILLVLAILGFAQVIIKEVAIANNNADRDRVRDVIYTAYIVNGTVALLCTFLLILFSDTLASSFFKTPELKLPLIIFAIAFTPQIVSRILSASLVGYKKIWQSNLVDQTLSMVIIGLILFVFWAANFELEVTTIAVIYAVARVCVTVTVLSYWKYINQRVNAYKPKFLGTYMFSKGLPLLIVSASLLISSSADTIMLGWLSNTEEVGLYNVAAKLALLTSFFLQITISTIGPKIAVMYKNSQIRPLELLLQRVTTVLTGIGLLSLLLFVLLGRYILGVWGEEFVLAYPMLVILATGQFFNIASGPVGNILVMTNNEKIIRNITAFTVSLNLVLNFFLIQRFNASGAAIATAFTTVLNMILCYAYVRKKTGLKMFKFI